MAIAGSQGRKGHLENLKDQSTKHTKSKMGSYGHPKRAKVLRKIDLGCSQKATQGASTCPVPFSLQSETSVFSGSNPVPRAPATAPQLGSSLPVGRSALRQACEGRHCAGKAMGAWRSWESEQDRGWPERPGLCHSQGCVGQRFRRSGAWE